jgi:endo-1,4-beta-xylanase
VTGCVKFDKKAKGTVTYTRVADGSSKYLSVSKTTGKVTVKKGTKAGTYKIKIKVSAAGSSTYAAKSTTVTVTVKVKPAK